MGVLNAAVVGGTDDDSRTVISNVITAVEFASGKRERTGKKIILIYDIHKYSNTLFFLFTLIQT